MQVLFPELDDPALMEGVLVGRQRELAIEMIEARHYLRSVSSGKTHYFGHGGAVVSISLPANPNIGRFLLGRPGLVWELTRLWAEDGHERDLLTRAIARATRWFRGIEADVDALVSYADPNANHTGHVYRAASWVYTGESEESRAYIGPDGEIVARRKFHSGNSYFVKAEIEQMGFQEIRGPGKHRFAFALNRWARRDIRNRWEAVKP